MKKVNLLNNILKNFFQEDPMTQNPAARDYVSFIGNYMFCYSTDSYGLEKGLGIFPISDYEDFMASYLADSVEMSSFALHRWTGEGIRLDANSNIYDLQDVLEEIWDELHPNAFANV